ncbi:MAG: hypothetical protein JSU68_04060, partial [Phycisphaerales bacterium]
WTIAILLAVMLLMFGDVLLVRDAPILSAQGSDIELKFAFWRAFAAQQFRDGNIPLWNPHIFAGSAFLGGFQSALLYPFNMILFWLPLPAMLNISFAMHIVLAGLLLYAWCRYRGVSRPSSLLAGLLFSYGSALFMRIHAGHISAVTTVAWAPLVFLSVDAFIERRAPVWVLIGIAAVSMQILAGHPQHFFYTAVCAGAFALVRLTTSLAGHRGAGLSPWQKIPALLIGLAAIYAGGVGIGAAQLLPGLDACGECRRVTRAGPEKMYRVSYEFCARDSFPPENFASVLAPYFLGGTPSHPYWGRGYRSEATLFIGAGGFILAVLGGIAGERRNRTWLVLMVALTVLLALGKYTPLLRVLYTYVPGFDLFRCNGRFALLCSMFLAFLAGVGLDALTGASATRGTGVYSTSGKWPSLQQSVWIVSLVGICVAVAMVLLALWIRHQSSSESTDGPWHEFVMNRAAVSDAAQPREAGAFASRQGLVAAASLGAYSALLFAAGRRRRWGYAILVIASAEVLVFARVSRATIDRASIRPPPAIQAFLAERPGDYRISWRSKPNISMVAGWLCVDGYDALQPQRVTDFLAYSKIGEASVPETTAERYRRYCKFHRMLRCRYVMQSTSMPGLPQTPEFEGDGLAVYEIDYPLPHVLLVEEWEVLTQSDEILDRLASPEFDPLQTVILERSPDPAPSPGREAGPPGEAQVLRSSTDEMMIQASLSRPAILLITDGYFGGWRARSADLRRSYDLMPADYALRAIPLEEGEHVIHLEYAPASWRTGVCISLACLLVYAMSVVLLFANTMRRRTGETKESTIGQHT